MRSSSAQPVHAYAYVKPRFGQFVGVVRANGHETETQPLATREAARDAAAAMLRRVTGMPGNAELGMRWWNRLREIERAHWLARADSAVPADAWAAFQRQTARDIGQEASPQKPR